MISRKSLAPLRQQAAKLLTCLLLATASWTGTAHAADAGAPLASDVARNELMASVTGKRNAMPLDVSKILPRLETRIALRCERSAEGSIPAGCSGSDLERLKFSMELRDNCIYGVEVFDHVETKDRPKYCAIIAEGAESQRDFQSAAIFRQRACDLGQGKSCKKALADLKEFQKQGGG